MSPPPGALPDFYGLVVRFGDRWNPPTADYRCRCGHSDSAKGPAAVQAFANTAARIHRAACHLTRTGATQ